MAKRNGLWHAEAMALAGHSPATIALIVHVSERQVRRLLAAASRGGAASDQRAPTEAAISKSLRDAADAGACEPAPAAVKSAARELLEAIIEPAPIYPAAAPRRVGAVALIGDGASLAEAARQLGCGRSQVERIRDNAVLAGELEPPTPEDAGEKTVAAAKKRCDAHLADLVAVYGAPRLGDDGQPRSPFELPIRPGPARFVPHGGFTGSGSSSPAAACADLG
ncbi:MAG: helix-turn-helix domain-containing protein [Roseiarcus sp.]|jgi:DNA-binding CsgD family transcriptional regulator